MKMLRVLLAASIALLPFASNAQPVGQLGSGQLWGNSTAARAPASPITPSALIDRAISSTQGAVLTRNGSAWIGLAPGTAGLPLLSGGAGANLAYGIPALAAGGTGANLTASNGGVFYSTGSAGAILSGTATARQMLQSGASGAPGWSTSTWPATTTINRLLWSSAANVISDLATANNGVLITSAGGVPSIAATLPCTNLAALTGDITTSAGSCATTLATVATGATTGGSTAIPVITFNNKGLVTAVSTAAVIAPAGTLSGSSLAAGVTGSSLTGVGTLTSGATGAGFTVALTTSTITGNLPIANAPSIAANTVLGSIAGGTAVALTTAQHTTLVNAFTATLSGAVNPPTTATGKFLRDDNSWQVVAGTGTVTSATIAGTTGNIVVSGTCTITTTGTCTADLSTGRKTLPTSQVFTLGTDATYTTPANVLWLEVYIIGGGGGGGASGSGAGTGVNGNPSCWKASGTACSSPLFQAGGGTGAAFLGAAGGSCSGSGSFVNSVVGQTGGGGSAAGAASEPGGGGGSSPFIGGGGGSAAPGGNAGNPGVTNTGGGGSGATAATAVGIGGGGGGGAGCYALINTTPAASYVYTVGATAAGGTAGTSGAAGGAGAAGKIWVIEHYN